MRTLLATTLMLSLLALGAAPQGLEKRVARPAVPLGPVLMGEDDKPVQGVRLSRADIKVIVHGNLAQATMILTFANDLPRVLGGNLVFPLPEGATVTGYGLEINGQIVDGVAVEKERARIIYESELHKRVDPGLVENVEGNAFRTRLYPIPAKGTRSIKIEYVTQIGQEKDGASVALPLGMGDGLDDLSIHIEAPEATAAPAIKAGGIDGLTFAKAEHGFVATASAKKAKTAEELVIGLPELPAKSVVVEKRLKIARTVEDLEQHNRANDAASFENFFVVTDTPAAGQRQAVQLKNQRVGIVWDASLSRGDADHGRELKLLESVLNHLGNPSTDLIVLRNDVQLQASFANDASGVTKLIETIKSLPYDGATALGSLIFPKNATDYSDKQNLRTPKDYDCFLLFTDGFGNLGADRPLRAEVPVYAMSDDVKANHSLLRSICQESGGSYFNLKRATDEQVLAGVGDAPFSLVSIECKPEEISEVYPPIGTAINGRFTVSGKLLVPEAKLTLHYGYGKDVVASETFTISAAGANEGSLLPRFWAQQKISALSLFPDRNAGEITKLGKQFNLVTPNTSLLVLETVEQYVQYRVVPPPSRAEIYKQFLIKIEEHRAEVAKTQEEKLQQVVAMWNGRVQWWEQEYKYPKNLKVNPEGGKPGEPVAVLAPLTAPPGADTPAPHGPVFGSGRNARPASAQNPTSTPTPRPADADIPDPNQNREARAIVRRQALQEQQAQAHDQARESRAQQETGIDQRPAVNRLYTASDGYTLGPTTSVPGSIGKTATSLTTDGFNKELDDNASIVIKTWDPKTPYIAAMKAVAPEKAYDVYLAHRKDYSKSPAFYFDCADYLVSINQRQMGIRVLTDIVELELHDARLLRVAAHRLNQIGERDLAIDLFEKVLKLRPEEPQSYRDLALALADRADSVMQSGWLIVDNALPAQQTIDSALSDYARCLELLNKVVLGNWSGRFPEIELPVLMEANDIAAKAQRLPGVHDFHNPLDARLQKNLDCDVRVVMTWDADQTDIDLWVTEPSREKCFYAHNRTIIGGLLSHDFTDGYGPEEYCLRKLMPGKYTIQANYYGSRQQELTGPATVQATVITNFGRPNEKRQAMTLRLKDMKEVVDIGTVTLGDGKEPKAEATPMPAHPNN